MMKAQVMAEKDTGPGNPDVENKDVPPEAEEIWYGYYAKLTVYVRTFARFRYEDVQDLVQEIFVKIFSALDRYNPQYTLNTWIYSIARNHCIDTIKNLKSEHRTAEKIKRLIQPGTGAEGPESEFLRGEAAEEIRSFIAELGETDRQICFLRFYEGLKLSEIAAVIGEPVGTVKYRAYQVREKLRAQVRDYFTFGDEDGR
jgi:RNA polymerase sigma-70 factor, ECF subfamily